MLSYAQLTPDNSLLTVHLLHDISHQLHSLSINQTAAPSEAWSTGNFRPSTANITTATLWFLSLVCSLASAQLGIFVKQWTRDYTFWTTVTTPQLASGLRQYRYEKLREWSLPTYVALLSVLLQVALVLFFTGLFILVWHLDNILALIVTVAVGLLLSFAAGTTVLPAFMPSYPYRTPASTAVVWIIPLQLRLAIFRFSSSFLLMLYKLCTNHTSILQTLKNGQHRDHASSHPPGDVENGSRAALIPASESLATINDQDVQSIFLDADWVKRDLFEITLEPTCQAYASKLLRECSDPDEKRMMEEELLAIPKMTYTARSLVHLRGRQGLSDDDVVRCLADLFSPLLLNLNRAERERLDSSIMTSIRIHFATIFFAHSLGFIGQQYAQLCIELHNAWHTENGFFRCAPNETSLERGFSQLPHDTGLFRVAADSLRLVLLSAVGGSEKWKKPLPTRFVNGLLQMHTVLSPKRELINVYGDDENMRRAVWEHFGSLVDSLLRLLGEHPTMQDDFVSIPLLATKLLNGIHWEARGRWDMCNFLDGAGEVHSANHSAPILIHIRVPVDTKHARWQEIMQTIQLTFTKTTSDVDVSDPVGYSSRAWRSVYFWAAVRAGCMALDFSWDNEDYIRGHPPPVPAQDISPLVDMMLKVMKRESVSDAFLTQIREHLVNSPLPNGTTQSGEEAEQQLIAVLNETIAQDLVKWLIRAAGSSRPLRPEFVDIVLNWGRARHLEVPVSSIVEELRAHFGSSRPGPSQVAENE